ncbi:MAG TPA: DUF2917 domain-containing protein [Burkholderiales bacterium]|nr:DUF2917 domain-containing protein [Burkholderiales bacterium]
MIIHWEADAPGEIVIGKGHTAKIEAYKGLALQCVAGSLWVARPGDARDHILIPGLTYVAPEAGPLLVDALSGRSSFRLRRQAGGGPSVGPIVIESPEQMTRDARAARAARLLALLAEARHAFSRALRGLGAVIRIETPADAWKTRSRE